MKKELDNMIKVNRAIVAERDRQAKDIAMMEEEIKDTIEIYTKMIE